MGCRIAGKRSAARSCTSRMLGALALLASLVAVMALSIPATAALDQPEAANAAAFPAATAGIKAEPGNGNLALYSRIADRVVAGEGYYSAAMAEQRASDYPTRPFVAVRLPTLALLDAALGLPAMRVLAMALLAATTAALQFRLEGYTKPAERVAAQVLLVFAGAAALVVPQVGLIHDVFAGLLLTLALLLHRPNRWWPSLLATGLALAIRELAAPFMLLWLVFALASANWREAAVVSGLLGLFALGMTAHYFAVEAGHLPGDPASQG